MLKGMDMKVLFKLLLCFLSVFSYSYANHTFNPKIVFIFGTSCAGKSSLSKQLLHRINEEQWKLIDRDIIIEECQNSYIHINPHATKKQIRQAFDEIELRADELVLAEMRYCFQNRYHVIIDTQFYHDIVNQVKEYHPFSVLVYAPLHLLLERDQIRNQHLNRSNKRQFYAKAFIFETFAQLYQLEQPQDQDAKQVDQINPHDWDKNVLSYCLDSETKIFFEKICDAKEIFPLWSKNPCDLVIDSAHQSIEEAVQRIVALLFLNEFADK